MESPCKRKDDFLKKANLEYSIIKELNKFDEIIEKYFIPIFLCQRDILQGKFSNLIRGRRGGFLS